MINLLCIEGSHSIVDSTVIFCFFQKSSSYLLLFISVIMGSKKKRVTPSSNVEACIFCGRNENNEVLYGKLFHQNNISVHQNCMFFSCGLVQHGTKKNDGILNFRIQDIKQEVSRGNKLRCCYCKNLGATLGCIVNNCRRAFHFPCGVKHRVLNQHFGNFASYCPAHKKKQEPTEVNNEPFCYICCSSLSDDELKDCLYAPCCKNNWFHHLCLQKYALSAGQHFFKCPLCNNSTEFVKEMQEYGICIPNKDAAWELETNAYQDLLYRPECGAESCKCKSGRGHDGNGVWSLLPCSDCGAVARHKQCENLTNCTTTWVCDDCKSVEALIETNKQNLPAIVEESKNQATDSTNVNEIETAASEPLPSCSYQFLSCEEDKECNHVSEDKSEETLYLTLEDIAISDNVANEDESLLMLESKTTDKLIALTDNKVTHKISPSDNNVDSCLKNFNRIKIESTSPALLFFQKCNPSKRRAQEVNKIVSSKKKRRKTIGHECCSKNTNRCIRKMFGLECHSYRV